MDVFVARHTCGGWGGWLENIEVNTRHYICITKTDSGTFLFSFHCMGTFCSLLYAAGYHDDIQKYFIEILSSPLFLKT